jgi:hypothetical protein
MRSRKHDDFIVESKLSLERLYLTFLFDAIPLPEELDVGAIDLDAATIDLNTALGSRYSSRRRGVKPQFLETMIFWRPGNLYCERRRASMASSTVCHKNESVIYFII